MYIRPSAQPSSVLRVCFILGVTAPLLGVEDCFPQAYTVYTQSNQRNNYNNKTKIYVRHFLGCVFVLLMEIGNV